MKLKYVIDIAGKPETLSDGKQSKEVFDLTITYLDRPGGPTRTEQLRLPRRLVAALRMSLDAAWPEAANPPAPTQNRH
jgi:hypothetical protein